MISVALLFQHDLGLALPKYEKWLSYSLQQLYYLYILLPTRNWCLNYSALFILIRLYLWVKLDPRGPTGPHIKFILFLSA